VDCFEATIAELKRKGYNIVRVRNAWVDPRNPYQGTNVRLVAPNGQKFELQFHTQESFNLKNGALHDLYEKQRLIKDEMTEAYLALTDEMFAYSSALTEPVKVNRIKNYDLL
jgi:hypothetical protein